MTEISELSDWKFKIKMINMLRKLMEKEDNMQEQVDNVQMGTLRKKQREILEVKTKEKNAFDGFISTVNLTKERIMSIKIGQ